MIPVAGAAIGSTLGGIIVSALTYFFTKKLTSVLSSLGIAWVVYDGLDEVVDELIQKMGSLLLQSVVISGGGNSVDLIGLLRAAGFHDAAGIIVSGFTVYVGMKTGQIVFKAISS